MITRLTPLGLIATVALCACPVALSPATSSDFRCQTSEDCVAGYVCFEGYCASSPADAAVPDAPASDNAAADRAAADNAMGDTTGSDAATSDAAQSDAATGDAAQSDAATSDAAQDDAAASDAAQSDAAMLDAAGPDTAMPDATTPDSAMPDTAVPDAATPDAAPCAGPGCWWDPDWAWRQKLSFNNLDYAEDLRDFPVLVKLDSNRIDYGVTHDSGHDLRFVDADGQTVLAHEIEGWDESGDSFVWVRVPQIDGASNSDHIWMYYGHSGPSPLQRESEVWTNGFQAVYHLDDNLEDSSPNAFHGTNNGANAVEGKVAGAREFDGSNDYIDMGQNRPFLRDCGYGVLSVLFAADDIWNEGWLISISVNTGGSPTERSRAAMGVIYNDFVAGGRASDSEGWDSYRTANDQASTGTWYHFVSINDYVNEEIRLYVNGSLVLEGFGDYAGNWTSDTNASFSAIGGEDDGTGSHFDGIIDEARVANVERSDAWIAAQYWSQTDNGYVSFGGPEQP